MSKSYCSNSWDWDYYWLFEGLSQIESETQKMQMLAKTMAAAF